MSEKAPTIEHRSSETLSRPEHHKTPEQAPVDEQTKHEQHKHDHNIDKIQQSIHKEAVSSKETPIGERAPDKPVLGNQREVKAEAYRRTLVKVRRHLDPAEQTFSKFVHKPLVESVSEVSGKTIARPSGILGGGLAALLGGGFILYMAKHFGFQYNFSAFVILFGSGFLVGLCIESIFRLVRRKTSS